MGDQNEGRAVAVTQPEQHVDDRRAVGAVQIAGRLICEQDRRPGCCGACQSHPLLFTAGHLGGIVISAVRKTHVFQFSGGFVKGIAVACQLQLGGDVFQCCHRRNQMKGLEHHAHVIPPESGQGIFVHRGEILSEGQYLTGGGLLKAPHQHQKRGFTGPRRANQPDTLAFVNLKRDAVQDIYPARIAIQRQSRIFKRENLISHALAPLSGIPVAYGDWIKMRKVMVLAAFLTATAAQAEETVIAALGDSLTQGYGLPAEQGFVPQLQAWLDAQGADVRLINAGVSGDTTAGGLSRAAWTLTPEVDAMIVALGGNDLLRGIDPGVSRANLEGILTAADSAGVEVLLVGMQAPGNYGPAFKEAFDAIYPELARETGALYAPDFFEGLQVADGDPASVRAFMQPDGIHPNAEGVARIVEALGPRVLSLVEKTAP